jgi:hypothetical protein
MANWSLSTNWKTKDSWKKSLKHNMFQFSLQPFFEIFFPLIKISVTSEVRAHTHVSLHVRPEVADTSKILTKTDIS